MRRSIGDMAAYAKADVAFHMAVFSASHNALLKRFAHTVAGDEVEHAKPAPDIYLEACRRLHAEPGKSIALEDSPNGVASAEAAGCRVVAVPSLVPIPARPGRVVAASLTGVDLAMLRRLVASG